MNKTFSKIFEVYVFAYAFFFASRQISDADFWFHLKTGEYIFRTGMIPRTEMFSFTHYGVPWVAHGWLSGAIFYAIYSRLGFNALIFIFAILTALAFWIVFKRSHSHPAISGLAALLGVWTVLPNIGVRPRVFTILLSSVYLALLSRYARRRAGREIWCLVPMMVVWANLHGGFLIGLTLIALAIVGILLDGWAEGAKLRVLMAPVRMLYLVLLACLLGALINPYGLQIYTFPLMVLRSPVFQNMIVDWFSPDFHGREMRPLLLLILLTIAAFALSPGRVRPSDLLLFLVFLYGTLKTQRHAAILALIAAPLFADYFQKWLDSTSLGRFFSRSSQPAKSRAPIIVGILMLVPLIAFAAKLKSSVYATPTQRALKVPVEAVRFLRENQIKGNTFTAPNIWGGYVIWELPSNPVFYDGRDVYPEHFVQEFGDIMRGLVDWNQAFERYGVQIVLIEPKTMLARQLQESPAWERLYQDEMSVLFRKRESPVSNRMEHSRWDQNH